MTKADLIEAVYQDRSIPPELSRVAIKAVLEAAFGILGDYMATAPKRTPCRFTWPGFGSWHRVARAERKGRDPRTGHPLLLPAHRAVRFHPAGDLRNKLNPKTTNDRGRLAPMSFCCRRTPAADCLPGGAR